VVPRDALDQWLDPALTEPGQALALLSVTEGEALEAYAVSTEVNSVQNNDPSLLRPLAETDAPAPVTPEPASPPDQDRLL
jgi:putative SOS response-associated peptidase YedK